MLTNFRLNFFFLFFFLFLVACSDLNSSTPTITTLQPEPTSALTLTTTPTTPNKKVLDYLNNALDFTEAQSIKRGEIDWKSWRLEVLKLAGNAQTPADTYPAIRKAIYWLKDHHSHFLNPQEVINQYQYVYSGLGLYILITGEVVFVYPTGAAYSAGIRSRGQAGLHPGTLSVR